MACRLTVAFSADCYHHETMIARLVEKKVVALASTGGTSTDSYYYCTWLTLAFYSAFGRLIRRLGNHATAEQTRQ